MRTLLPRGKTWTEFPLILAAGLVASGPRSSSKRGSIVLWWWLIAGVAIWLCSGALIPLGWALSVAIGRWRRETSPEHAAVVQDVAAG